MDDSLPDLLRLAKIVSAHSDYKMQMGCVIAKHSKPISIGFNRTKSHPKWMVGKNSTVHAEAAAIMACDNYNSIRGGIAYVYRELKNGMPAMARPCVNCMQLLRQCGVKKVVYSQANYPYFAIERI